MQVLFVPLRPILEVKVCTNEAPLPSGGSTGPDLAVFG